MVPIYKRKVKQKLKTEALEDFRIDFEDGFGNRSDEEEDNTAIQAALEVAKGLEKVALEDQYFVDRKLYPNVDFYSGIIYRALGIPMEMFTVMFAMGRLPGWIAHWVEMHHSPTARIGRPRQIYTGPTKRDVIPMSERG